jgi:CRISPR system Cascade subunit CasB
MTAFICRLEQLSELSSKVRAELRKSLAFDPGTYFPVFSYVEPYVAREAAEWHRKMLYLVAGLWASHRTAEHRDDRITIARACAKYRIASDSSSVEKRFVTLLDAADDQLPHRLRHMVALLKDYPLDFECLLSDLLHWNKASRHVQNRWAREFYREIAAVSSDKESQE